MLFLKDIILPLVIAMLAISFINFVIIFLLRILRLDIFLFKLVIFLAVWYFVGPVIYNFLLDNIMTSTRDGIEFIYMPIQYFLKYINKLM